MYGREVLEAQFREMISRANQQYRYFPKILGVSVMQLNDHFLRVVGEYHTCVNLNDADPLSSTFGQSLQSVDQLEGADSGVVG